MAARSSRPGPCIGQRKPAEISRSRSGPGWGALYLYFRHHRTGIQNPGIPNTGLPTEIPAEAETLLTSEPLIAHLATSHGDRPHVAPLWYVYRDGTVEIATTGRKLDNIRRNPRVALSVQKDAGGHPRWGVTLQGHASIVADDEEGRGILHRINRRYGTEEDAWAENTPVRIAVETARHWVY